MIERRASRTESDAPAACSKGEPWRAAAARSRSQAAHNTGRGMGWSCRAAALAVALSTAASGCYVGEWRAGAEVPIATTSRLLPTRTIESWELSQTQTPYIIQVKGTSTPRCRSALYGRARRIDTGKFERVGGGFWTTIAIILGAAGGALAGFGGSGYVSNLQPTLGRPIMYGVGGAMIAGGLAACFTALARPAQLRYAMCGIFTGLGAAVIGGAVISGLAVPGTETKTNPTGTPYIDTSLLQTMMLGGGGAIAGSVATGLVGNLWSGFDDRVRSMDVNNAALWDTQQAEANCGPVTALYGRTVGLDIIAENAATGPGSEATPLKLRIALSSQSTQPVDLRGLRQSLPSCGVLRVQLNPDVVYEEFADDYTPPVPPDQMNLAAQPIFGHISPTEGLTLPLIEGRHRQQPKAAAVHGLSSETLVNVERRCRGEEVALPGKKLPGNRPPGTKPPVLRPTPAPEQDPATTEPAQPTPETLAPPPASALPPEELFFATPGQILPRANGDQSEDGECSLSSERARFSDCEGQCAKALSLSPCVLDFRKCYLDSRGSTQVQHDRDQCNLAWEQCLFRVGVSPGSWRRCVEGCSQANHPYSCQQKKPERDRTGP